jgi:TM2 domain-containing membrane protein YozV
MTPEEQPSLSVDPTAEPDAAETGAAGSTTETPPSGTLGSPPTLPPGQKYCQTCAAVLDARALICPRCGVRQPRLAGSGGLLGLELRGDYPKSRVTATVLAIVLGVVGAHRWYFGQWLLGLIYAVFFPIAWLVGLVEGTRYGLMSDEEFEARYGHLHWTSGGMGK